MTYSTIEWTERTWNPVTGCTKISPGCKYCYAEAFTKRLVAMKSENYINGFKTTSHDHMLDKPLKWKKSSTIFVNSMSDIFHEDVSDEFILKIFKIMNEAHWHQFQVLTKRPERLADLNKKIKWSKNIWMGTSVETAKYKNRISILSESGAKIKFLSLEPLLGNLGELNLIGIDWVIVGGESGPKSRPMELNWVNNIKHQCLAQKVPFFFKQWGGKNKKKAGRILEGRTWDEMPKYHLAI